MHWSGDDHAGFSSGRPWLPVASNYREVNVEKLRAQKGSMLQLYRQLIQLRKSSTALRTGLYRPVSTDLQTLLYLVEDEGERFLVCLNLTKDPVALTLDKRFVGAEVVLSTNLDRKELLSDRFVLRSNEGVIARHRTTVA
jgi:alpha-glucosidase